ncbi:cofactor-independent phosphoglycerate mutase [Tanacetum coccineum]
MKTTSDHFSLFCYLKSYLAGMSASGALTSILRLITKAAFKNVDNGLRKGALTSRRANRHFEEEGPILCAALDKMKLPLFPEYEVRVRTEASKQLIHVLSSYFSCDLALTLLFFIPLLIPRLHVQLSSTISPYSTVHIPLYHKRVDYSPAPLTAATSPSPLLHRYLHVYGCDDGGDACGDNDGGAYGISTVHLILRRRIDGVCDIDIVLLVIKIQLLSNYNSWKDYADKEKVKDISETVKIVENKNT